MNTSRFLSGLLTIVAAAMIAPLHPTPAQAQTPHTHQHSFGDARSWSATFDDPSRDAWQKPMDVLSALGLARDSQVADIGSGTGYFTVRIAHHVQDGRVYGVDVEPAMVKHLDERARAAGLRNVIAVQGTPSDPSLPTPVDVVLMVDVFHHIADRPAYLRRLAGSLKPGGRIAIIDFNATSPVGPPPAERISASAVKDEMIRAGYAFSAEHAFLPNQYFVVFSATGR
jgi:cyclopropane fatty-acyl-phospholipid synthase-like methyltransferase